MAVLLLLGILFWGSLIGGICMLCLVIHGLRLVYNWFRDNNDFDIFDEKE